MSATLLPGFRRATPYNRQTAPRAVYYERSIAWNLALHDLFGRPQRVDLQWNEETREIAIIPVQSGGYKVSQLGSNLKSVSSSVLYNGIHYTWTKAVKTTSRVENGILYIGYPEDAP